MAPAISSSMTTPAPMGSSDTNNTTTHDKHNKTNTKNDSTKHNNNNGTNSSSGTSTNGNSTNNNDSANRRIDLEKLVIEFQSKLGENWDRYQSALCLFLLGKLSRKELSDELENVLDKQTTRMHNQLLLANLANALRDSPTVGFSSVGFGGPASKKQQKRKTSSQYEKIKKDILALPPRERRRLKNLQKDSGKKQMITSSLVLTRQELLPKVPLISKTDAQQQQQQAAAQGKSSSSAQTNSKDTSAQTTDVRVNNTALWTQEILQGISTLNSSESFEMADVDLLKIKMTQIMRENGLIGKANDDVMKIMLLGIETHLKTLVESIIDVVSYRKHLYATDEFYEAVSSSSSASTSTSDENKNKKKRKRNTVITIEDVFDTLEQQPALVDFGGPLLRLSHSLLKNDDDHFDTDLEAEIMACNDWEKLIPTAPLVEQPQVPGPHNNTTTATASPASASANSNNNTTTIMPPPSAVSPPQPPTPMNNNVNSIGTPVPATASPIPGAGPIATTATPGGPTAVTAASPLPVANAASPPPSTAISVSTGPGAGASPAVATPAAGASVAVPPPPENEFGTRAELKSLLRDILLSS